MNPSDVNERSQIAHLTHVVELALDAFRETHRIFVDDVQPTVAFIAHKLGYIAYTNDDHEIFWFAPEQAPTQYLNTTAVWFGGKFNLTTSNEGTIS